MNTISVRVSPEENKLIHEYASVNNLNLSQFIRDAVRENIEADFSLDEDRILNALNRSKNEKRYDHTEVWKMLEV